jgi:hypothetical protein
MKTIIRINFDKTSIFEWNGVLNNEELKPKMFAEKFNKINNVILNEIKKDREPKSVQIGTIKLFVPYENEKGYKSQWGLTLTPLDNKYFSNIECSISDKKITIKGELVYSIDVKTDTHADLINNIDIVYIDEIQIWHITDKVNSYVFTKFFDWDDCQKYNKKIVEKLEKVDYQIEILDKLPKLKK